MSDDLDVSVDSSSTPDTSVTTDPAPTTPETPRPQEPAPFHQHPRFRELTTQNRELRSTVSQLSNRLNQLERTAQQHGGATAGEQREYAEAAAALKRVIAADPELAELMELRNLRPQLAQSHQGVQHLQAQAARAQMQSARSHIERLVQGAGINVDRTKMGHVIRLVAGAAMNLPDGNERYERGDLSVLDEAFADVKAFIDVLRKDGTAVTAQTKTKTKQLPPAPGRGGAAGPAAPQAPKPGEERAFVSDLHKKGLAMLRERLQG
jgi:hypothetical protein